MPKHRREPSPHRYSDIEDEEEVEEEEDGQQHHQQEAPGAQAGTGPTGSQDRPDRSRQAGQGPSSSRREKSTSPIKRLINLFVGMCKS